MLVADVTVVTGVLVVVLVVWFQSSQKNSHVMSSWPIVVHILFGFIWCFGSRVYITLLSGITCGCVIVVFALFWYLLASRYRSFPVCCHVATVTFLFVVVMCIIVGKNVWWMLLSCFQLVPLLFRNSWPFDTFCIHERNLVVGIIPFISIVRWIITKNNGKRGLTNIPINMPTSKDKMWQMWCDNQQPSERV